MRCMKLSTPSTGDWGLLEKGQQRATKTIRCLECLMQGEAERAQTTQPQETEAQVDSINVHRCLVGGVKKMGVRLFSVVSSEEAMGTN